MRSAGIKIAFSVVLATLLLAGCRYLLNNTQSPFGWIGLAFFIICLLLCVLLHKPLLRNAALMLAFLALPLALVEFYLGSQSPDSYVVYEPVDASSQNSDILGYGPLPDSIISAKRYYDGELIYDAHYTINHSGLRETPASPDTDSKKCLLFLGGSFTFGEGLDDTDTVANHVSEILQNKIRVYNFGYSGYGPHQLLAALESGWVKEVAHPCEQVTAVYTGVTQHIARVSGHSWWDLHGPEYKLDENGKLYLNGHFDDGVKKLVQRLRGHALKSHIFNLLFSLRLNGHYSDQTVELYASVVAALPDALRRSFGRDAQFKMLQWHPVFFHEDAQGYAKALASLEKKGIRVDPIDANVLPGSDLGRYKLHPREGHPNSMANEMVAGFIVDLLELK